MKILKDIHNVPAELKNLQQWVAWRAVERDGRITKMPVNATTGRPAKSNDPATWTDFESACDGAVGLGASGVGFCFSLDDGLVGIDLDACIDGKGKIAEWALIILSRIDCYAEISPSGRGLKIWCRGKIDKGYKKNLGEKDEEIGKAPGIEVYTSGRYFTVTGERWEGAREDIVSCQQDLDWLIEKYWPVSPEAVQTTVPQATYTQATSGQDVSTQERAARYLARMPVAVSGEHGHDVTFRAACVLMLGFALSADEAWPVMAEWNQGCNPPWGDDDLRRKLNEANKQGGERGFLLTGRSYEGPDVDLRNILNDIAKQEIEPADIVPNPSNFPRHCLEPDGFVGELIRYNLETAMYPLPELALAGSLSLLSTLCGQKIIDKAFGTRPNGYFCGLAPTGGGKEHARKINKEVLHNAGLEDLEGEENFASSASIWSAVDENPVGLYQLDEFSALLATTHDAKKSPHLFKIVDTFLRLYSGSDSTVKADAYADRKKNKVAKYPNTVIYGTSVPQNFWESLTAANVTDGLLGRFMVFEVPETNNGYVDPQHNRKRYPLPDNIVRTAMAWRALTTHEGNLASLDGSRPLEVEHTPEAFERADSHMRQVCERRKTEAKEACGVWSRTPEKTNKLALLFAVSRATPEMLEQGQLPCIELHDVEHAIALSNWLTRRMLHKAGLHVAHNDWEREVQRALSKLVVGEEVKRRVFTRKTQHLKSRDRDDVLKTLVETGFVSVRQDTASNGSITEMITRTV